MPKSKRQTVFHLSKTEKKGRQLKESLVEKVREACDNYEHVYVFQVANMRNQFMKEVRQAWKDSKFFFGSNRVMAKALGQTAEEEYKTGLMHIAAALKGNVGLLFTNNNLEQVKDFFESCKEQDYARGGAKATVDFTLAKGLLSKDDVPVPHNMEPHLRKLGLPTQLIQGKVHLREDYVVCSVGDTLTPEQAQILKQFDIQSADFELFVVCHWHDGTFEAVQEAME